MISMLKTVPRFILAVLFAMSVLFVGCNTIGQPAGAKAEAKGAPSPDRIPLRTGETIKVTLVTPPRGNQTALPQEHKVTVKEDGTIALPYFPSIPAAGKSCKELEELIYAKYVPDYYKSLGVTVEADTRFFYVSGEVGKADRHEYFAGLTVTRAISASQGFTEYANRKKIKLIRANGRIEKVNWNDAIENPAKDPAVYPGDTIEVPRRVF
jgi:protein involved in polysaccharide export with SLBB domain